MDAAEYNDLVAKRLNKARRSKNWSQDDLAEECKALGLEISQSTLSRVLKGTDKLDPYRLFILSQALELDYNELLSVVPTEDVKHKKKDAAFITDATSFKLRSYMGKYYGYFYSTENKNDNIHCGEFDFYTDELTKACRVSFRFETGQRDTNGEPISKVFDGTAKLSDTYNAICCQMESQDIPGDVSYIIFKYAFMANQPCMCRLGMVITIGAGLKRLPVAQKILICRQKLEESDNPFILGQLKLNDEFLYISEQEYEQFTQDPSLPDSFKKYLTQTGDHFKSKATPMPFLIFREEDVTRLKKISREDKVKVVNLLRKYSNSKRCKKIGPKSEDLIFEYLNGKN